MSLEKKNIELQQFIQSVEGPFSKKGPLLLKMIVKGYPENPIWIKAFPRQYMELDEYNNKYYGFKFPYFFQNEVLNEIENSYNEAQRVVDQFQQETDIYQKEKLEQEYEDNPYLNWPMTKAYKNFWYKISQQSSLFNENEFTQTGTYFDKNDSNIYLYHGTTKSNRESINNEGLVPSVGEFLNWACSGACENYEDLLEPLVFLAKKENLKSSLNAIQYQISRELNKDFHDVSFKEIIQNGLLMLVEIDPENMFRMLEDDGREVDLEDMFTGTEVSIGVESPDIYSRNEVFPTYFIEGKDLGKFILENAKEWINAPFKVSDKEISEILLARKNLNKKWHKISQSRSTLICIDIQKEASNYIGFNYCELADFMSQYENVVYIVDENMAGRTIEPDLHPQVKEYYEDSAGNDLNIDDYEDEEEYLQELDKAKYCSIPDHIDIKVKAYGGVLRTAIDMGVEEEAIKFYTTLLSGQNLNPKEYEEFIEAFMTEYGRGDFEESFDELVHISSELINGISNYFWKSLGNSVDICGGGINECLKEVQMALEILGINYNTVEKFTYGKNKNKYKTANVPEGLRYEDVEEYGEEAYKLSEKYFNVLKNTELKSVIVNETDQVVGALFTDETDSEKFSFDVVVHPDYQRQGIGIELVKEAISEFEYLKDVYGDDYYIDVHVINPNMRNLLEDHYGFEVDQILNQSDVTMKYQEDEKWYKISSEHAFHTTNIPPEVVLKEGLSKLSEGMTNFEVVDNMDDYLPKNRIYVSKNPYKEEGDYVYKIDISGLTKFPDLGSLPEIWAYLENGTAWWKDRDVEKLEEYPELFQKSNEGEILLNDITGEDTWSSTGTCVVKGPIPPERIKLHSSLKSSKNNKRYKISMENYNKIKFNDDFPPEADEFIENKDWSVLLTDSNIAKFGLDTEDIRKIVNIILMQEDTKRIVDILADLVRRQLITKKDPEYKKIMDVMDLVLKPSDWKRIVDIGVISEEDIKDFKKKITKIANSFDEETPDSEMWNENEEGFITIDFSNSKYNNLKIPTLNFLESEALKYDSFNDFEDAWLREIKHGLYWHLTDNINFFIDPKKGPSDMSSIATGEISVGKLMITSNLEEWVSGYGKLRPFAAMIDMSDVPSNEYYQVKRGFGNEFFVNDPSNAKVIGVYPVDEALFIDSKYNEQKPQNQEDLKYIFNKVHKNIKENTQKTHMGEPPMENVVEKQSVMAFNLNKNKAFNLNKFKEATYNWRSHQFREDWRGRQRVNSFEGINTGDWFKTKKGRLEIVGIEVDDPGDPNSAVYLVFADENGNVINLDKPYRLNNYEWNDIETSGV